MICLKKHDIDNCIEDAMQNTKLSADHVSDSFKKKKKRNMIHCSSYQPLLYSSGSKLKSTKKEDKF